VRLSIARPSALVNICWLPSEFAVDRRAYG
jgi:hypothetical protein